MNVTPTLNARKVTECSETLIPPQIELDSVRTESRNRSRSDYDMDGVGGVGGVGGGEPHYIFSNPTVRITQFHYYILYIWAILWFCIAILQVTIYVKMWHIIKDIKAVKQDWNNLKLAMCQFVTIPRICQT